MRYTLTRVSQVFFFFNGRKLPFTFHHRETLILLSSAGDEWTPGPGEEAADQITGRDANRQILALLCGSLAM